jgi:hypothetical protein
MPDLLVQSFAPLLQAFQPCFTHPSFRSFGGLVCAWILCSGRRSLTRRICPAPIAIKAMAAKLARLVYRMPALRDEIRRPRSGLLRPSTPAMTGQASQVEGR